MGGGLDEEGRRRRGRGGRRRLGKRETMGEGDVGEYGGRGEEDEEGDNGR